MTNQPFEATAGTTFRLMYRSRNRLPAEDRDAELSDLFTTSRSNNKKRNITGALLLSGHWFVQVLEGDENDVRSLFAGIEKDPRHDEVELLHAQRTDGRVFAHWSMAKLEMDDADLPVIARIGEISPANSRRMTPTQQHLLEAMRNAMKDRPDL